MKPWFTRLWLSGPLRAIKSKILSFTIIIIVQPIGSSLCDYLNKNYLWKISTEDEFEKINYVGRQLGWAGAFRPDLEERSGWISDRMLELRFLVWAPPEALFCVLEQGTYSLLFSRLSDFIAVSAFGILE